MRLCQPGFIEIQVMSSQIAFWKDGFHSSARCLSADLLVIPYQPVHKFPDLLCFSGSGIQGGNIALLPALSAAVLHPVQRPPDFSAAISAAVGLTWERGTSWMIRTGLVPWSK